MHVTVIGGGAVGLCCAHEAALAGADVTVIDSGDSGYNASSGNAGWISPFLSTPRIGPGSIKQFIGGLVDPNGPTRITPNLSLGRWLLTAASNSGSRQWHRGASTMTAFARSASLAYDRLRDNGVKFEMHRDGLAIVARTAAALDNYKTLYRFLRTIGYSGHVEEIESRDITRFDPALHCDLAGALHLTDERHVRPESLIDGLCHAMRLTPRVTSIQHQAVINLYQRTCQWHIITPAGRSQHRARPDTRRSCTPTSTSRSAAAATLGGPPSTIRSTTADVMSTTKCSAPPTSTHDPTGFARTHRSQEQEKAHDLRR